MCGSVQQHFSRINKKLSKCEESMTVIMWKLFFLTSAHERTWPRRLVVMRVGRWFAHTGSIRTSLCRLPGSSSAAPAPAPPRSLPPDTSREAFGGRKAGGEDG